MWDPATVRALRPIAGAPPHPQTPWMDDRRPSTRLGAHGTAERVPLVRAAQLPCGDIKEVKLACLNCRRSKVKCGVTPDAPCNRCVRLGVACVLGPAAPRSTLSSANVCPLSLLSAAASGADKPPRKKARVAPSQVPTVARTPASQSPAASPPLAPLPSPPMQPLPRDLTAAPSLTMLALFVERAEADKQSAAALRPAPPQLAAPLLPPTPAAPMLEAAAVEAVQAARLGLLDTLARGLQVAQPTRGQLAQPSRVPSVEGGVVAALSSLAAGGGPAPELHEPATTTTSVMTPAASDTELSSLSTRSTDSAAEYSAE